MAGTYACFYWSDWLSDPELRSCSALSRSLWMDMLCLAGVSEHRGFVMVGDKPATALQLSRLFGETPEVVERCMEELETNGVFSRDREGRIYSRRIVRDAKRVAASSKGGKKGGRVTHSRKRGIFSTQDTTPDSNTKYQIPNTKPPTPYGGETADQKAGKVREDASRVNRICRALRLDMGDFRRYPRLVDQMVSFEQRGIDIDADLIPCIEQMAADGRIPEDVRSLAYFDKPARAFAQARAVVAQVQTERESERMAAVDAMTEADWKRKVLWWLFCGEWAEDLGAPPLQPGCRAPIEARAIRKHYTTLGEKPYAKRKGDNFEPFAWPAGEHPKVYCNNLNLADMERFLNGGEDARLGWWAKPVTAAEAHAILAKYEDELRKVH